MKNETRKNGFLVTTFFSLLAAWIIVVGFASAGERVKINMGNGQVRERVTGSTAAAITVAPGWAWRLDEIYIDMTEGEMSEGEPVTVTRNSTGTDFDSTLPITADLATTNPSRLDFDPWVFGADDAVTIGFSNAHSNTYALEVQYTVWDR